MEQQQKQIKYFILDLLNSQKWLLIDTKTHSFITIYKNNRYQTFPVFELLIEGGEDLKVKLSNESEYTTVGFSKPPQEGDSTTPCADGSIWIYENNKWTKYTACLSDTIQEHTKNIYRRLITRNNDILEAIERKLLAIEREVEEFVKRGKEKKEVIRTRKDIALTVLIMAVLFFAGIGLIYVISFITN